MNDAASDTTMSADKSGDQLSDSQKPPSEEVREGVEHMSIDEQSLLPPVEIAEDEWPPKDENQNPDDSVESKNKDYQLPVDDLEQSSDNNTKKPSVKPKSRHALPPETYVVSVDVFLTRLTV